MERQHPYYFREAQKKVPVSFGNPKPATNTATVSPPPTPAWSLIERSFKNTAAFLDASLREGSSFVESEMGDGLRRRVDDEDLMKMCRFTCFRLRVWGSGLVSSGRPSFRLVIEVLYILL